ncbi:MAG: GxxExxY protein, partial [Anaerolineae bacterium]
MTLTKDAPHKDLTYRIIGLAMEVHNELGPGHREADYHDALHIKLRQANLYFEDEPPVVITLDSGEVVKTRKPDFVVDRLVIVELKGRSHLMTKDDQAQVIGYFAALP